MFAKLARAIGLIREAWLLARVPSNQLIFDYLGALADQTIENRKGIQRYLEDYASVGRIDIEHDWSYDRPSREMRLVYSNSLFAKGCLRLRLVEGQRPVVVFLPGNTTSAQDVLGLANRRYNMTLVADKLRMSLACWDWPLQGTRRDNCLYMGLRSLYSAEREYSRILPALSSCLWREKIAELQFALVHIRRLVGEQTSIYVVGWSMGASFAYFAPLLSTRITMAIAAGSCARVRDLLVEGKTRLHGYFFYPLSGLGYFDLDDVVEEVLKSDSSLKILYGELDPGCLHSTSEALQARAERTGRSLEVRVLPAHGHMFSPVVKHQLTRLLAEAVVSASS